MIIAALFKHWLSLRDALLNPLLSEQEGEVLGEQARAIILAMAETPAAEMSGVLRKLEAYGREIEAGPCEECDLLLASALEDRSALTGPNSWLASLATSRLHGHGRTEPRTGIWDDPTCQYPFHRGQDRRSPTA